MVSDTRIGPRGARVAGRSLLCLLVVLFLPAGPPICGASASSDLEATAGARLLFFTASWCAPCKKVEPVLVGLAEKLDGQLQLVIIDFDKSPIEVSDFQVEELPTIILLDSEEKLLIRVDGASKDGMKALMEEIERLFRADLNEGSKEERR